MRHKRSQQRQSKARRGGRPDRRQGRGSSYRNFALVHEDDHIAAVSKPDGVLVNMAERDELTLQDQVRRHLPKSSQPDAVDAAAVHRLDRYTSGLVLFGRTKRGLEGLSRLVREGELDKRYYVLTVGAPRNDSGKIDASMAEVNIGKRRMAIDHGPHAQEAITEYEVEEKFGDFTLIRAKILTGRTHQLRVHFESIACPIACDGIYGDKAANRFLREKVGLMRQFIHARSLAFEHPITGHPLELEAKLPKDLAKVLKKLRSDGAQ